MKTKKSKTRFALRKGFALLLSICLAVTTIAAAGSISASAETDIIVKRGLAISAYDSNNSWFRNDMNAMEKAFEHCGVNTVTYENTAKTLAAITSQINSAFSSSDSNDVNYLFISSHGGVSGVYLNGADKSMVTFATLRSILDEIPGRFVIMINSCHSGSAIDSSSVNSESLGEAEMMMNSFLYGSTDGVASENGELANTAKYTVFCSSVSPEVSWGYTDGYSFAVIGWAKAIGYNPKNDTYLSWNDINGDNVLVPGEIHDYAYDYVCDLCDTFNNTEIDQHLCYYSRYSFLSVFYTDYPLGDITMDNCINDDDLDRLRKYLAKWFDFTDREKQLADLNADGKVDLQDLIAMRKYLADF